MEGLSIPKFCISNLVGCDNKTVKMVQVHNNLKQLKKAKHDSPWAWEAYCPWRAFHD